MAEYIERKALDGALTAAAANDKDKNRRTWAKAICVLHDIPAADVAPVVHGYWIEDEGAYPGAGLRNNLCSVCGKMVGTWKEGLEPGRKWPYCPNCGARMDGDSDAEEG